VQLVRKRVISAALAALLALLAVAGIAISAPDGDRESVARLVLTTEEADKSTGAESLVRYANPPSSDQAVRKIVTTFERGTAFDDSLPRRCQASDEEIEQEGTDACPNASRVGGGVFRGELGGARVAADVTLYNAKDEVIVISEVRGVDFAVFQRAPRGKRKLTIEIRGPVRELELLKSRIEIEKIGVGGKGYLTTPRSCPSSGEWTNKQRFVYRDGAESTERVTSLCRDAFK